MWVFDQTISDVLYVVSTDLLHGFEQMNLQKAEAGNLRNEWSGDDVSPILRSLAYASH
jgi:hypothetical protein